MAALEVAADNLPAALDWERQASQVDRQDHELAAAIAREMYHLRLPEEGDYWLARVQALAREAYDFLLSVRPEINQYDQIAPGIEGLIMQWASIGLMTGFETFENRQAAWNRFTSQLDALGFPWRQDPADRNHTWNFLMNGEVEQAIDHYLKYELTEPLAGNLNRHRKPLYALYAPVYEDPRVAAKLIEDAERYAQVREEVREMLAGEEWSGR